MRTLLCLLAATLLTFPVLAADKIKLKGIQGKDDRISIENYQYPWSAIGRVNILGNKHCTGTLVAPKLVLTAAHCLYHKKRKRWHFTKNVHFLAGYRRGSYIEHSLAKKFYISPTYKPERKTQLKYAAADWALIELKHDMSKHTGYIGIENMDRAKFNGLLAKKTIFSQAGYSQDKAHILTVNENCKMLRYNGMQHHITNECDAVRGDSGSPIFYRSNGSPRIAAVMVSVRGPNKNKRGFGAAAATSPMVKELKKIGLWKSVQKSKKPTHPK